MAIRFPFDNSYARDLDGLYVPWEGAKVPGPEIVAFNHGLAGELGLDGATLDTSEGAAILSGSTAPLGAHPLAMAYAGHQFGGFSPQLGDGRALLLGEVIDRNGKRRDIHLKGSGRTPFSRGGDGKAVLGPVLREFLIGEAMHALGIPTIRALAAVTTGETIVRQDGPQPGAVLARVAASHLRVGTFQFFAARREMDKLRQLADYAIARHDPDLTGAPDRYLRFFERVQDRQADLLAQWVLVGFVHGVMNTDNMTISGETIDYGPCAFIDIYDPNAVFSSIDHHGRYAYASQPKIAQWNLARLAECLVPLIAPDDLDRGVAQATEVLEQFPAIYQEKWLNRVRPKLGLTGDELADLDLANGFFAAMEGQQVDFTQAFRRLAAAAGGQPDNARALFLDPAPFDGWLEHWQARFDADRADPAQRIAAMNRANPIYIPRNHKVEEALSAATGGDFGPFRTLLEVLAEPYTERPGLEAFAAPAPDSFGPYTTFCGT
ncbi:YdiU family protein [Loktanella sp. IMCC34160]|nr:YdiU family protein [Loktanella sp. IMCC34160]